MTENIHIKLARIGSLLRGVDVVTDTDFTRISDQVLLDFFWKNEALFEDAASIIATGRVARIATATLRERGVFSVADLHRQVAEIAQLARAIHCVMGLALRDNSADGVRRWGLSLIGLGSLVRNGGGFLDACVGSCFEGLAIAGLRRITKELGDANAKETLEFLNGCCRNREPFEQIWRREVRWTAVLDSDNVGQAATLESAGWPQAEDQELNNAIKDAVLQFSTLCELEKYDMAKRTDDRSLAQLRLLLTEVALMCFQQRHGRLPDSLNELCPTILDSVPQDPFRASQLVYRRNDQNFTLYSVGDNGRDDGGLRASLDDVIAGWGDLFVDTE